MKHSKFNIAKWVPEAARIFAELRLANVSHPRHIDWYSFQTYEPESFYYPSLARLVSHEEMRLAFETLEGVARYEYQIPLALEVCCTLFHSFKSDERAHLSTTDYKELMNNISKSAKSLSDSLLSLLLSQTDNPITKLIYSDVFPARANREKKDWSELSDHPGDQPIGLSLGEICQVVSDIALQEAKAGPAYFNEHTPGSTSWERVAETSLLRALSCFMFKEFDQPLHGVVSAMASAALDLREPIDADKTRKQASRHPGAYKQEIDNITKYFIECFVE